MSPPIQKGVFLTEMETYGSIIILTERRTQIYRQFAKVNLIVHELQH